jgi:hypothetical protein
VNDIGFPMADQADFRAALGRLFAALDEAGEAEVDQPGDRVLEPGGGNPLLNATSPYINGVELDELAVLDFWRYRDTSVNWRITEGYTAA